MAEPTKAQLEQQVQEQEQLIQELQAQLEDSNSEGGGSSTSGAERIIHRHMTYAAGVGLIPVPAVDMVGVSAIQIAMVRRLAKHYHGEDAAQYLNEKRLKAIMTTMLASIAAPAIGGSVAKLFRQIPIVRIATFAVVPSFHAASTYALGKTFDRYFAERAKSGDAADLKLTHFNIKEQWGHFKKFYGHGRSRVSGMYKSFGKAS